MSSSLSPSFLGASNFLLVTFRSLKQPIVPISTYNPTPPILCLPNILSTIKEEYFTSLMNISAVSPFTSILILIHSFRDTGADPSYEPGGNAFLVYQIWHVDM